MVDSKNPRLASRRAVPVAMRVLIGLGTWVGTRPCVLAGAPSEGSAVAAGEISYDEPLAEREPQPTPEPKAQPGPQPKPEREVRFVAVWLGPTFYEALTPRYVFDPGAELSLFYARPGELGFGLHFGGSRSRFYSEGLWPLGGLGTWVVITAGAGIVHEHRDLKATGLQLSASAFTFLLGITASLCIYPDDAPVFLVGFTPKIGGGF